MLVVSRKINEAIVINDDIIITVVDIRGDKVRLGADVPRDGSIHRREVHEAIRQHQQSPPTSPIEQRPPWSPPDHTDLAGRLCRAMEQQSGRKHDREQILAAILESLAEWGIDWDSTRSLDELKRRILRGPGG